MVRQKHEKREGSSLSLAGAGRALLLVSDDGRAGRQYTLWHAANLVSNVWSPVTATGLLSNHAEIFLLHTNSRDNGFYKVDVSD